MALSFFSTQGQGYVIHQKNLAVIQYVDGYGVNIVLKNNAEIEYRDGFVTLLWSVLGVLLVGIVIVYVSSRQIYTAMFGQIIAYSERVAAGDYKATYEEVNIVEIDQLAASVTAMASSLIHNQTILEQEIEVRKEVEKNL